MEVNLWIQVENRWRKEKGFRLFELKGNCTKTACGVSPHIEYNSHDVHSTLNNYPPYSLVYISVLKWFALSIRCFHYLCIL